jgi:elongation factor G
MNTELTKVRNIGIMAHIDAGKTTVTERVLYYTGRTHKMGEVHDGTAVMDYLEEEQTRGITITSAATRCPWKGYHINLIDTPGHIDFTAEVERSLRVLDGAVLVIDGSEGVQAQTETVWRQGKKYDLPCLFFINKMDKVGADFEMSVASMSEKLLAHPVVLQVPIGAEGSFAGIIDLIEMRAVFYKYEKLGAVYEQTEIPSQMLATANRYRARMLEQTAEYDERLMDAYLHDKPVPVEMVSQAVRKATLSGRVNPVFVGSALKYIGIQKLLDGVASYLPSPAERPEIVAHKPGGKQVETTVRCDRTLPLVALTFKITSDAHGDLYFLRIYQGTLRSGSRVLNTSRNKRENVTRIFEMHADDRKILDSVAAGDIVAVVGLKHTLTGDTLCEPRKPVVLPSITFPETVVSMSIEPKTAGERAKLADALSVLKREDPTFECAVDSETGQTIIRGMGELHLEVLQHKLVKERGIDVRIGKPRVAYKEAVTKCAKCEGRFVRQTGGRGQYGHVVVQVEPVLTEDGHYARDIEFESKVGGQMIPREYIPAVERGVRDALGGGGLVGYPVVGIRVTLVDGSYHTVDSSDIAFEQAGAIAVEKALKEAGPVLLEPIMRVQVTVPEASFGLVQSGLLAKRGLITDCRVHGGIRVIDAKVPLAEMFGYSSEIRSTTGGRGTFTMEPLSYERIPEAIAQQIVL